MQTLQDILIEFRMQLKKGMIQKAYRELLGYMSSLRNHLSKKYPELSVSGSLYSGMMDMSYFSLFPNTLKNKDLKIAVVFLYDSFRFEVWLSGKNKQILTKYWHLFNESNWNKYKLIEPGKGVDSVLENTLVNDPDFSDLYSLTEQIEAGVLKFIQDVEEFLLDINLH